MNKIFAKRFGMARQLAGLSMQELADKLSVSKQAINKYEKGEMMPSSAILIKLSNSLKVDIDYFNRNNINDSIKLVNIAHREKNKIIGNEIDSIIKSTVEFLERYFELEKSAGEKSKFTNPVKELKINNKKDAEKAARIVRKKWKLGNGPVKNVIGMLETQGIKVYRANYSESFNGFSAWAGTMPVIVVNISFKEITRVRFTALHELGHLILQISEDTDEKSVEKICHAFAGELLLPSEVLIFELGSNRTAISMQELIAIKEKYGISIYAIMVEASILQIISNVIYNSWKSHYDECVKNETGDFGEYKGDEVSNRFDQLLFKCLMESKISVSKAANLSGKSISTIHRELKLNKEFYNYAV